MSLDSKALETSIPESTSEVAELPTEPATSTGPAKEASPLPDLKPEFDKFEPSPELDAHPSPPAAPAFKPRGRNDPPVVASNNGKPTHGSGKPSTPNGKPSTPNGKPSTLDEKPPTPNGEPTK